MRQVHALFPFLRENGEWNGDPTCVLGVCVSQSQGSPCSTGSLRHSGDAQLYLTEVLESQHLSSPQTCAGWALPVIGAQWGPSEGTAGAPHPVCGRWPPVLSAPMTSGSARSVGVAQNLPLL